MRYMKRVATETAHASFWLKVDKNGTVPSNRPDLGRCWIWTGRTRPDGRGELQMAGKKVLAHRLAWQLTNGAISNGLFVCHHCDNPPCVNPAHLFLGTPADNSRDALAKGRLSRKPRLNPDAVRRIRRLSTERRAGAQQMAREYGVDATTIVAVISRRKWKSVSD